MSARQVIEFEVGSQVTFNAYGNPLPAIVKKVSRLNSRGEDDGRVFYSISGESIISNTSGLCIMESQYFGKELS